MIEHFARSAALDGDVTFTGVHVDTLQPIGTHDVDGGALVLTAHLGHTAARCERCSRVWLVGFVVHFRDVGTAL